MNTRVLVIAVVCCVLTGCATAPPRVQHLNSGKLPTGTPFSEAVRVGSTLYLRGMLGSPVGAGKLVPGGIKEETRQTMDNLKALLEANDYAMSDLVKCTVMLVDMTEFGAFNDVYRTYFKDHFPARTSLGVTGLALGARVEVECIAAK